MFVPSYEQAVRMSRVAAQCSQQLLLLKNQVLGTVKHCGQNVMSMEWF